VGAGIDSQKMLVGASHGSARLLRVQDARTGRFVHFFRRPNLTESFVGPQSEGGITIEGNYQYSRLDPMWIRSSIGNK
jgi:hypothetical protein